MKVNHLAQNWKYSNIDSVQFCNYYPYNLLMVYCFVMMQDNSTSSLLSMLSKKGMIFAHLNICSLRNKTHVARICNSSGTFKF